ncbi:MAG TPA: PAS domain S-box protein [Candidatus Binatia bacterium]|nr:PAS domain S-box protein [Candidatus Binatia bacterium]
MTRVGVHEMADGAGEGLGTTEEHFRLLVDSVTDYAICLLDQKGHIRSWNHGAERIFGYRSEEILGQHVSVLYPEPETRAENAERELRDATSSGRFEEEGWRLRKDGSQLWASVITTPLRDGTAQSPGYAHVTLDLTRRREMDELNDRLARMNDRVELARRVQNGSIGELFRISLVLQSLASQVPNGPQLRIDQLISDIDNVIVDLRRHIFET